MTMTQQQVANRERTQKLAYYLWSQAGKPEGKEWEFWFAAEFILSSCPNCKKRVLGGLPWFAETAATVCPACGVVVIYEDALPRVAIPKEVELLRKNSHWIDIMLKFLKVD